MLLTSFGRVRRLTERAAERLETPVDVLELDVNKPDDIAALVAELSPVGAGSTASCTRSRLLPRTRSAASS